MSCETHPDNDIFDELYPPAEDLPRSDEYTDESQAGMYGRSVHDLAIIKHIDPAKVWSITEEEGCLFASPGFRVVNWLHYFVSENARPEGEDRDYQWTVELDDENYDDDEDYRNMADFDEGK
jgi:hypothetical protein